MENLESGETSGCREIHVENIDAVVVESASEELTAAKLNDLNERLKTVESFVEKINSTAERKGTLAEDKLQELIEEAVGDGGRYGSSRNYIRTYLFEQHGIVLNDYMKSRVNRILRKLCAMKRVEVVNGNLFCLVKD